MPAKVEIVPAGNGVELRAECHFSAPPETVFAFFAVHENLMHVFDSDIRRRAAAPEGPDPNGLGSLREIRMPPGIRFEERIERFERPSCIEYRVTRGGPVKNHYGRMMFSPDGDGTRMNYSIQLTGKIPGTTGLIARLMAKTLAQGLPKAQDHF